MLFDSWQFKITVYVLFLALCLGQEQVRLCERDYCYERSVDRRTSEQNTLTEWHRFRIENIEGEKSTPLKVGQNHRDVTSTRINERRVGRDARQNHRLPEKTHQEKPERVEGQSKTDVTRHLAGKDYEELHFSRQFGDQEVVRQRETSIQMNKRDDTKRERDDTVRHLNDRDVERRSKDNRESLRQLDERDLSRRPNVAQESHRTDGRLSQNERQSTLRYDQNKQDQQEYENTLRQLENRKTSKNVVRDETEMEKQERHENSRRLADQELKREVSSRLQYNHIERLDILKRYDDDSADVNRHSERRVERLSRKEHEPKESRDENKVQRDVIRRSKDIRKERQDSLKGLSDQESGQHLITPSIRGREQRHNTLIRFNEREVRDVSRLSDIDPESEHIVKLTDESKQERVEIIEAPRGFDTREAKLNIIRYLEDSYNDNTRQLDDRKTQQDIAVRAENDQEKSRGAQRYVNKRFEDNREKLWETLRRFYEQEPERDIRRRTVIDHTSQRTSLPLNKRSENNFKREEQYEFTPRFDNREVQRDEDNRNEIHLILKLFDDRETQRYANRRTGGNLDSKHSYDELSQRKQEFQQRHNEEKLGNNHPDETHESQRVVERSSLMERKSIQRRDQNVEGRIERHETSRRLNNREVQITRSDIIRESQHRIERPLQREHESIQRREHILERRGENHEIQSDDSRRLEGQREERQAASRRLDDREGLQETSTRNCEAQLDVTRHTDDETHFSRRIGERLPQTKRESIQHRDQTMWKCVDRSEQREERYQIMRQLNEREVSQHFDIARQTQHINRNIYQTENKSIQSRDDNTRESLSRADDRKKQYDVSRSLEDTRKLFDNDKRLEVNNGNRQIDDRQKFQLSDQHLYQVKHENRQEESVQLDTKSTFKLKQKDSDSNRFIQEDYTEKTTIFLPKSYIVLGQGAILAYVIMKTLNGKNHFKNQIPIKLCEALEVIGF